MKKCRNCKQPFEPRFNTLEKYCWNSDCKTIEAMQKLNDHKKKEKQRITKKKKELLTHADWLKIAQQSFNKFIRERDKGKNCISCNKPLNKKFDAGHYWNKHNHGSIRFDELNVNGQCVYCNQHLHGNLIEYGVNLEKLIGVDEFAILRHNAYETKKWSIDELKRITEYYKKMKKSFN
jgi:hypothetical protein